MWQSKYEKLVHLQNISHSSSDKELGKIIFVHSIFSSSLTKLHQDQDYNEMWKMVKTTIEVDNRAQKKK